jgi:hypothetical protein
LAGSLIRRCRKIFIRYAYNRTGVRASRAMLLPHILPPDGFNPLKAWFDIETPDGVGHRHTAEWERQRGHVILLKSETLGG